MAIWSFFKGKPPDVVMPLSPKSRQIFANIYFDEFDHYVRHLLKPLAYVRYGDDFMLFYPSKEMSLHFQHLATKWLADNLHLVVHPTNNVMVAVKDGVHFLGHWIFSNDTITVDKAMRRKMFISSSRQSVGVYKAMHITDKQRKLLTWSTSEDAPSLNKS